MLPGAPYLADTDCLAVCRALPYQGSAASFAVIIAVIIIIVVVVRQLRLRRDRLRHRRRLRMFALRHGSILQPVLKNRQWVCFCGAPRPQL